MSTTNDVAERPRKRRRWWLWVVAVVVAVPVLLIAALPWILSSSWVKPRLEAAADKALAPGGVSFDRVGLSWFQPTEIAAPALIDAAGHKLVQAPSGTFSWSLWDILFKQPVVATLTLHNGAVAIGRSEDGDVDLVETLKPILKEKPEHTIQIRIQDATLKFTQQGLADPFYADHADLDINLTRFPEPISWDLKLARDKLGADAGKMTIAGEIGRDDHGVNFGKKSTLAVTAAHWPWRISPTTRELAGLQTSGLLSGAIDLKVLEGALTTSGDVALADFLATGPKLAGDELKQADVKIGWKAEGKGGEYHLERFALDAPAATLAASGEIPPAADRSAKLEGRLDLTVANQLRRTLHLLDDVTIEGGAVALKAEAVARPAAPGAEAGQRIEVTADLNDLAAKKGDRTIAWNDPTTLAVKIDRTSKAIALEQLDLRTPFLTATGRGDLDAGIIVDAAFDLAAAREKAREWVDLGEFEAAGAGTLHARYSRQDGKYQLAADGGIKGLSLAGLPVVDTLRRDELKADLAVRGEAQSSGLPRDWQYASLIGRSAEDELKLETTSPPDRLTPSSVNASVRTTVDFNGAKRVVEASGSVVADATSVDASQLRVAASHFVGPGGQFMPEAPYVWRGSARYDLKKDELTLTQRDLTPEEAAREREPAFSVDKVTAGGLKSQGATWFHVNLSGDLASIQDVLGGRGPALAGTLAAEVDGRQNKDDWKLGGTVQAQNVIQVDAPGGKPQEIGTITVDLDSNLAVKAKRLDVALLSLDTPFGKVDGRGSVSLPDDAPVVDMAGTLAPNWERLTRELAARIEPNASIKGRPHAWALAGTLPMGGHAESPSNLKGEIGLQLDEVDVFGMRLEKTLLHVRANEGKFAIDPIDGMLNSGRLQLDPQVSVDEQGKRWLRLGKGSRLTSAVVNDEVSHRVLAFAAPVLDNATRVEGKVSFDLDQAVFSLDGDATKTQVDGDIQFDEVKFMPGPLVDQLIAVFNLERRAMFVLRDPVSIRILGRTIYQEGLILPVGDVAVIGLEGWMDFDKRIDMMATFAAVPPRRNIPVLSTLLENAQIRLPLTGTIDKPKIDGEQIKERFKNFGEDLLETTLGIGRGIGDIFRRPRPNAAPAPTPVPDPGPRRTTPVPPPPQPGGPADPAVAPAAMDDPDAELLLPGFRLPFSRTPEERQLQKEARQQRREEKKMERRARQGLPPN